MSIMQATNSIPNKIARPIRKYIKLVSSALQAAPTQLLVS